MEKILIDGYNLLYKDGALKNLAERSLERARESLLDSLAAYRSGDVRILVVFDGQGGGGASKSHAARSGVEVRFSRPPSTADQVILELIDREPKRASLTVVTSDKKDIGRVARAEGVRWVSSEVFLRRLRRDSKRGARREEEKPLSPAASEMEYWLKRFGSDPPEKD